MSETQPPGTSSPAGSTGSRPQWDPAAASPGDRQRTLEEHFLRHSRTHTPDALARAALDAGYSQDEVSAAMAGAQRSLAAADASAPTRARATRAILAAYGLTYLVFAIVFLTQPLSFGGGVIALVILTVVLLLALGMSALWARRPRWRERGASLTVTSILSLPIVLLILVAGTCAVTTFPAIVNR
jgi:hypothetical protein